jgi:hypothetical protein
MVANPLALLENLLEPTIVPSVCQARTRVPPRFPLVNPLVFFQPLPLILVVPKSTSPNSSHT